MTLCRFAFVEFATEENAAQALQSSKNAKMGKRNINVELYNMQENAYKMKGMPFSFKPTVGLLMCCKWILCQSFIFLLTLQYL